MIKTLKNPLLNQPTTNLNNQFSNQEISTVSRNTKSVVVRQCEFAIVDQTKENFPITIGSEEATTCVICIFSGNGVHIVTHEDLQSSTKLDQIFELIEKQKMGQNIDVYMVGAYEDEKRVGQNVVANILTFINEKQDMQFNIQLACVGEINTKEDGFPKQTSLALEIPSMKFFPAKFEEHGPESLRRRAAFWVGYREERNIYDTNARQIQIRMFPVDIRAYQIYYFKYLLALQHELWVILSIF
eukprot:TRINITY_DN5684_c1_g1_i1.p1 TRINITY_DN5684_c1_g1~~TRINITY_DN5684_c1_g1_i1.p1  ORF type:complete len:243 (-),score=19.95 TRINITY_DN5684_c1_g1_i1:74-802(-)